MQKTTKLMITGFVSLVVMSCSIGGFVGQTIQSPPPISTVTLKTATSKETLAENLPAPTLDPFNAAQDCLTKTWEIKGLSDYVLKAVPQDLIEEYKLEYDNTSGQAFIHLFSDKSVILQADELVLFFNAQFSIFKVPVTVSINGSAIGAYNVDHNTLTIREMDTSELNASAKALNEDLIESNQIIETIPFVSPPYNTAEYKCQDEILQLSLTAYPNDLPPLIFEAVE
jgi:hypothetical protein